ncbi:hypothetical protein T08_11657 [Trichinella sp. T8]|nr:hypothetical protein T08_11657 [Trichinella sp. T8]
MVRSSGKFHGKQTRACRINGLLNLPCAYLNTQGNSPSGTPLKRIQDVLCNISFFWATRFSLIFGPFRIN